MALDHLQKWLVKDKRLPLVIRGARQVGKTWLVRELARVAGKKLIELNLERKPEVAAVFSVNDPKEILKRLASQYGTSIEPADSILFIDEIQEFPELFAKLRWFAEDMPELPVIAAGSLLEFILGKHEMSMPVGRVTFMFLEPLSFEEFLLALGKTILVEQIKEFTWKQGVFELTHVELMKLLKEYVIIGGMPAAVQSWALEQSLMEVSNIHHDILQTYRNDFSKYGSRANPTHLNEVLQAVPQSLGKKFVYSDVNRAVRHSQIKEALELLVQARICNKVQATAANGLPLGAELLHHYTKILMLDVGLCSAALKLSLTDLQTIEELDLINKGGIAEQVVGQLLRTIDPVFIEPELYYWISTEKFASAEIDYVIQQGAIVVPIEVKAGKEGTLKSLHRYMYLKGRSLAARINSGPPQNVSVQVKDTSGNAVQYELRSVPFYLIGELRRLLESNP
ncbi:MAG: ATP-binding protein [Parachlamydiaceae bacterium]